MTSLTRQIRDALAQLTALVTAVEGLSDLIDDLNGRMDQMAATIDDLNGVIAELKTTVDGVATRVEQKLTDLQNQIAAGASAQDLSTQVDAIRGDITQLQQIAPS